MCGRTDERPEMLQCHAAITSYISVWHGALQEAVRHKNPVIQTGLPGALGPNRKSAAGQATFS
jgi:hypothetical protein